MKQLKLAFACILVCLLLYSCNKECIHDYQGKTIKESSCTSEGEEVYTCNLCNESYTQKIPQVEHTYVLGDVVREATCTEEGLQNEICSECGAVKEIELALIEHEYGEGVVITSSTCSEEGEMKYSCTHCEATKSEPIDMLPHTLGEQFVSKEPNCTEEGELAAECTVCGTIEVVEKIETNDTHVFTNKVIRMATCSDPGEGVNTCNLCQYREMCTYDLKNHEYGEGKIVKEATCTKEGITELICSVCGKESTEKIPALGHDWTKATCKKSKVCNTCGKDGGKADHDYQIIEETEMYYRTFPGIQIKECSGCGNQKTLHIGNYYNIDLAAAKSRVLTYAKSLGFKEVEVLSAYPNEKTRSVTLPFWQVDGSGGTEYLVGVWKDCVDSGYNVYASDAAGIGAYKLEIYMDYYASASQGGGFYSIAVYIHS